MPVPWAVLHLVRIGTRHTGRRSYIIRCRLCQKPVVCTPIIPHSQPPLSSDQDGRRRPLRRPGYAARRQRHGNENTASTITTRTTASTTVATITNAINQSISILLKSYAPHGVGER